MGTYTSVHTYNFLLSWHFIIPISHGFTLYGFESARSHKTAVYIPWRQVKMKNETITQHEIKMSLHSRPICATQ